MDVVRLVHQPPLLRQPTMIAAFEGWNDAGEAATTALEALAGAVDAQHFADLDPEEFFDFQVARPTVRLDGDRRRIEWPRTLARHDFAFLGHLEAVSGVLEAVSLGQLAS